MENGSLHDTRALTQQHGASCAAGANQDPDQTAGACSSVAEQEKKGIDAPFISSQSEPLQILPHASRPLKRPRLQFGNNSNSSSKTSSKADNVQSKSGRAIERVPENNEHETVDWADDMFGSSSEDEGQGQNQHLQAASGSKQVQVPNQKAFAKRYGFHFYKQTHHCTASTKAAAGVQNGIDGASKVPQDRQNFEKEAWLVFTIDNLVQESTAGWWGELSYRMGSGKKYNV